MDGRINIGRGNVLLAEPFMLDPNFSRGVILITDHGEDEGSVGFVLNKPVSVQINDLIEDFPEIDSPVYYGGPVSRETLHYIHDAGPILDGSIEICSGVYWSGDYDKLKFLIKTKLILEHNIRFFIGYSGWSAGQLNDELEYGSWLVDEMDSNYIFKLDHRNMWSQIMKNKGGRYSVIAEMPETAYFN